MDLEAIRDQVSSAPPPFSLLSTLFLSKVPHPEEARFQRKGGIQPLEPRAVKSDPLSVRKQGEVVDSPQRSNRCQYTTVYKFPNHILPASGKTVSFRGINTTF